MILLALVLSLTTSCSNVVRFGLLNSNSIMVPPGMERTVYVHTGNISENQRVSLNGINGQLSATGYQVVKDPTQAHYWLQARVVYCHKAKQGVTAESVAFTGFGVGIGSGGTAMARGMGGMKQPPPEGILYMCVADVFVTEQAAPAKLATPIAASSTRAATYTMRSVAHVLQKELNIEEATPIIQEKLNTSIAGLFQAPGRDGTQHPAITDSRRLLAF